MNGNKDMDEFSKKSVAYYTRIKGELESKFMGKFVALDHESETYSWGETATEAISKAKEKAPNKLFYLVQIGSPTTFKIQTLTHVKNRQMVPSGFKWAY